MQIKFLGEKNSIVLKYVQERTFRLSFYVVGKVEGMIVHGLRIDLKFDEIAYNSLFEETDIEGV